MGKGSGRGRAKSFARRIGAMRRLMSVDKPPSGASLDTFQPFVFLLGAPRRRLEILKRLGLRASSWALGPFSRDT